MSERSPHLAISRRGFLAGSAALAVGAGHVELAFAADAAHTFVLVELDGGLDALSAVVPAGEPEYYARRRSIAVPPDRVLPLDGMFGLHPALAPLHGLWQQGLLAVVPAVGSPGGTRSHFAERSLLARGVGVGNPEPNGWITRHLQTRPGDPGGVLRGIALSDTPARTLAGDDLSLSMFDLDAATPRVADGPDRASVTSALRDTYANAEASLAGASAIGAEALQLLESSGAADVAPRGGAYGPDDWSTRLSQIAQVLHAGLPVEAAVVQLTGWDTHQFAGAWNAGYLAHLLQTLGVAVGAFVADVSDMLDRVTIVVVSEFGRRVAENGSGGTDHGHGGVALVIGGGVRGGIHGVWPGLAPDSLDQGDVASATDVRSVLATVVERRLGNPNLGAVFPGWTGPLLDFA